MLRLYLALHEPERSTFLNNQSDYYNNWNFDPNTMLWFIDKIVSDPDNIIGLTDGYFFDKISNNKIRIYCVYPPLKNITIDIIRPSNNYTKDLNELTAKEINSILRSKLSLLAINDKVSYAFSDKLPLYLLGSCITSDEDIFNNIKRIQNAVQIEKYTASIEDV